MVLDFEFGLVLGVGAGGGDVFSKGEMKLAERKARGVVRVNIWGGEGGRGGRDRAEYGKGAIVVRTLVDVAVG